MGKIVTALTNFKVYPTIAVSTQEVAFQDKFVWDIRNLDSNIFRIGHGGRSSEIDGAEVGTFSG